MALTEELPIYKATYDLVLAIFNIVKNFNKEYKYTLGESIKKEAVSAVSNIFRANCVTDKRPYLEKARENTELVRLYIRLLKDLRQINVKQLVYINGHIENVSRQLTGWLKAQSKK